MELLDRDGWVGEKGGWGGWRGGGREVMTMRFPGGDDFFLFLLQLAVWWSAGVGESGEKDGQAGGSTVGQTHKNVAERSCCCCCRR